MHSFDILIVGGGVMGSGAACELARSRLSVGLIDQAPLPNPQGASIDHSKVFRFAYPDPFYVKMAVDSLRLWRELEQETGAQLMTHSGLVLLAKGHGSFETQSYNALRSIDLDAELLDNRAFASRFPQFNADAFAFAVYDPSGLILHADSCVRAMLDLARRLGVSILEGLRIESFSRSTSGRIELRTCGGERFDCAKLLLASGPWTRELIPQLSATLTTTRQEVVYFEPRSEIADEFKPPRFPMFIELSSGFYGFPVHHKGAMKIANHHKGIQVDPYSFDSTVGDDFIDRCRAFFSEVIPALANARVAESRVCIYNNTPDDDFIIDWHPELENVLIATGFSGHGFKFGSVVGRIAGQLLVSGRSSYDIERLRLSRIGGLNEVTK